MQYINLPNSGDFCRVTNSVDSSSQFFTPKVSRFSDGEISIDFSDFDFSARSKIAIVQSLFASESALVELLLAIDVVNRNTGILPNILLTYFSYARQDREISPQAPISAKVIADLISSQKIATISIVEPHSAQIQGFFNKPCFNISLEDFFVHHILQLFNASDIVICAADIGGAKSARKISEKIGCTSAIVEKVRPQAGVSFAMSLIGSVSGKICIIVDDIIDTAGTLCNAADMLMEHGAKSVIACASHGIFSGQAFERIEKSSMEAVFVSNTIFRGDSSAGTVKIKPINVSKFVLNEFERRILNF